MKKILSLLLLLTPNLWVVRQLNQSQKKTRKKCHLFGKASVYFLMTDRNNGDKSNDVNFNRTKTTGKLRGFEGGDIKESQKKIDEGYFDKLGINAIWFTIWEFMTL
jgi:alpha-amylase